MLLTACTQNVQPVIQFIGIGEGNMQSDVNQLQFADRFEATQRELVAVVAFSQVQDGTTVQATWFSPDDRAMPLGRTSVVTASGATVARFSLASRTDWESSPYLLMIDAFIGEGESRLTATGALHFFIDMTDTEIQTYKTEYEEAKRLEREANAAAEAAAREATSSVSF